MSTSKENKEDEKQIKLEPLVYIDDKDNFSLGCKIIGKEDYIITDIYGFGYAIYKEKTVDYGEGMCFTCRLSKFTEESRTLAEFICNETAELLRYNHFKSMFDSQNTLGKRMDLSISSIRRFFNCYEGKMVATQVANYGVTRILKFTSEPPPALFSLNENQNNLELNFKVLLSEIVVVDKAVDQYLIIENVMYKLDDQFIRGVLPLVKYALYNGGDAQTIIVPKTKVKFSFKENTLKNYISPPLIIKIYVDKQEDYITLKINYSYGDSIFNPYQEINITQNAIIRESAREEEVERVIKRFGFYVDGKGYVVLHNDELVYDFAKEGITQLMGLGEVYISEEFKKVKVKTLSSISLGVKLTEDFLEVNFNLPEISKEELLAIFHAYQIKKKFYKLKNGDYISLQSAPIQELGSVLRDLDIDGEELENNEIILPRYKALYLEKLLKENEAIQVSQNDTFQLMTDRFNKTTASQMEVPPGFETILRDYQKVGYHWLKTLSHYGFGGILADDMGLGKTLQVITLLKSQENTHPTLIVCPTSLVLNWKNEFEKFAPDSALILISGGVKERRELIRQIPNYSVAITSYELLKRDFEYYKDYQFRYCILDEAQYIKNSTTKNAKSVKKIKSTCRLALTGTPIENSLTELWSIFDFIMPGYLWNHKQFKDKMEIPITKNNDQEVMKKLRKMIAPFILRRVKKDVLKELPPKTETVLYTTMKEEQRKLYSAYILKAKKEVEEELQGSTGKGRIKILACLTRLRQLACYPGLFLEGYKGGSGKLESCLELVQNAVEGGHKILLFSQFTSMLNQLEEQFNKLGISYSLLTGSVKASARMQLIDDFNTKDTSVFLISLKAGGVGLNLTSADIVIHFDPWWNTSVQNQATDRAYRIGQTNPVQVFKLITKGSIEEKIIEIQEKKNDLTENILTTGLTLFNNLSKEEILNLFKE